MFVFEVHFFGGMCPAFSYKRFERLFFVLTARVLRAQGLGPTRVLLRLVVLL